MPRFLSSKIKIFSKTVFPFTHDDVIKWKHFPRNWPFVREIHRSPVNFPHKGQWRGALMFSLIYAWMNDWVNNREAGDLRRQHGHYDVIVMGTLHRHAGLVPPANQRPALTWIEFKLSRSSPRRQWFSECPSLIHTHYRKISNISRTKSPNLNVPHLVLHLYLPKLLMPGIKSRMKM